MKSTIVNNLLTIILFVSCTYMPENRLVVGHWKYVRISPGDSSIIAISDNDEMYINSDSSFNYHIESVKKDMNGKWTYGDHTLHLKYEKPDTLRHFEIDVLSKQDLWMHEGMVSFHFTRVE